MQAERRDMGALHELVQRASAVFQADDRITAGWLEGSFGEGTADRWSDVDLSVTVPDAGFESVVAERHDLIGRVGRVLGYGENPTPAGLLVFANLKGILRLDVVFIKESLLSATAHPHIQVLFDKTGVIERLNRGPRRAPNLTVRVETSVRNYQFGCFMLLRLAAREEWNTLQFAMHTALFEYVVFPWLAVDDPVNAMRPGILHLEHYLASARRERLTAFTTALHQTFAAATPERERLAHLIASLTGMIIEAQRNACERWGVAYPPANEASIRAAYQQELGVEIPASSRG